jgi:hypothetical protein
MCLLIIANSSSPGFASVNARVGVMDLNRLFWHPKQLAMVKKGCISVNMLIYFMVIIIFYSYHGKAHRYPLIRCRVLFSFVIRTASTMYPAITTMSIELTQCCSVYCLLCMKQTRFVYCLAMIVLLHVSSIRLPSSAPRPAAIFLSLPLLHVLHMKPSTMNFHLQYESSCDEQNRLDGLVLVTFSFGAAEQKARLTSRFQNMGVGDLRFLKNN